MSKVDDLLQNYIQRSNLVMEQDPAAAAPPVPPADPATAAAPPADPAADPAAGGEVEPKKLTTPGYASMVLEMIKLLRLDPESQISRDMKWLNPNTQDQIPLKDISEEDVTEKTASEIHKLISKLLDREPYAFTED